MMGPFLPDDHKMVLDGRFMIGDKVLSIKDFYNEIWNMVLNSL
jgi:hypothetical protein